MHLISYMDGFLPAALLLTGAVATGCLTALLWLAYRRCDLVMGWGGLCTPSPVVLNAIGAAGILVAGALYQAWGSSSPVIWTVASSAWILMTTAACYYISSRLRVTRYGISPVLLDPGLDVDWEEVQDYVCTPNDEGYHYVLICRSPARAIPDGELYRLDVTVPPEKYEEFEKIVSYNTSSRLSRRHGRPAEEEIPC
jgi:hypothetical protein